MRRCHHPAPAVLVCFLEVYGTGGQGLQPYSRASVLGTSEHLRGMFPFVLLAAPGTAAW